MPRKYMSIAKKQTQRSEETEAIKTNPNSNETSDILPCTGSAVVTQGIRRS